MSDPDVGPLPAHRPSVSIVVISHNYEQFLPAAVESALRQSRPAEVLVVDDGSTDGSLAVIAAYADRVRVLSKDNGGNSSVVNVAVPATSGELVMFLDADDVLHPDAAHEVAAAWHPGCAKVQFRLSLIDTTGRRTGVDPPATAPMPSGDVLPQLLATGRYVTPVMTGNAFSRAALERLLPIPERDFRNTNDGYLNALAPFFGDVISVDRELGGYRLHGRNLWAYSGRVALPGVRQRLVHDLNRQRHLVQAAREHGHELPPDLPLRDPVHVVQRIVSLRLDRQQHPAPGDAVGRLLAAGLAAAFRPSAPLDPAQRVALIAALPLVASLPPGAAMTVCDFAVASRPRPAWVRLLASILRRVSRRRTVPEPAIRPHERSPRLL